MEAKEKTREARGHPILWMAWAGAVAAAFMAVLDGCGVPLVQHGTMSVPTTAATNGRVHYTNVAGVVATSGVESPTGPELFEGCVAQILSSYRLIDRAGLMASPGQPIYGFAERARQLAIAQLPVQCAQYVSTGQPVGAMGFGLGGYGGAPPFNGRPF